MLRAFPPAAEDVRDRYGLHVSRFVPHPGGFESDCWIADDTWFIKMWAEGSAPQRLDLLGDLERRGLPVPAPMPTTDGRLCAASAGRPYAVFPYIRGRVATGEDWALTAAALRKVHAVVDLALPRSDMDEPQVWILRDCLDHPWIKERRAVVLSSLDRLEDVIALAHTVRVPEVLCHRDFGGFNLLIEVDRVAAILDWEQAVLGPREHDLWIAAEWDHTTELLAEYGATDLSLVHIEYALLARALRDMAARLVRERDRPGIDTWGFRRIAKLDHDLDRFRPFCAA